MTFGSIVVNSLTLGCTYALIGVGFVVVFRTTGVISFAQGFFSVLAALLFNELVGRSLPYPAAILLSGVLVALAGAGVYLLFFSRFATGEALLVSLGSIGIGTALEAVAILIWGPQTISIKSIVSYGTLGPDWFPITPIDVITLVLTVVAFVVIAGLLQGTTLGVRMRATASRPSLAASQGVNVVRLGALAWALAGMSGALAGCAYVITVRPDPGTVYDLGLLAFPAILLGGLDSIGGSLIGGLLIGVVQTLVDRFVGGSWNDVSAYLVLLAVLMLRPQGLFGSQRLSRP